MKKRKRVLNAVLIAGILCTLAACGKKENNPSDSENGKKEDSPVKVVLTTGFAADEVFRIGNEKATRTELLLYLTNIGNQYEAVYGDDLWDISVDEDTTMLDNLRAVALARLSQVKAMKLMAAEHQITLTEEEKSLADAAASDYLATMTDPEKEALGLKDSDVVAQMYQEKLLADKLYSYLIRDVNPEISDDEARIITVQHIMLKTYTVDEHGNRLELAPQECNILLEKAEEIHALALEGESFEALISKYSEDAKGTYSFGTGDMEESFEKAAFALATEEISPVVRTEQGYHIIKCISTLDREQTDLNKEKLLISRKQEVFGDTYNAFIAKLDKRTDSELILSMELPEDEAVDTAEFFTVYEEVLGGIFE